MRPNWSVCAALAIALSVAVAGTARAQDKDSGAGPVTWQIDKAKLPAAPLKVGDTFSVDLTAHIERGWHLYSLTPIENGPKPTRITIVAAQGFELAGKVKAPTPTTAKDPNFGIETEFYEDAVTFAVPVRVMPDVPRGKATAIVQVRYQTCNDKDCLPPEVLKLPVAVEIVAK
jgi:thiol:disulfide interchange protein DsbD